MNLGQLIDLAIDNIFGKYIEWFWGMGSKSRLSLVEQRTEINQKPNCNEFIVVTTLKMCTETIKNG